MAATPIYAAFSPKPPAAESSSFGAVPFFGAAIGAATSILAAREANRALERAAFRESQALTAGYLDERQQRAEQFGQYRSLLGLIQGASGGSSQLGSASLNFGELAQSVAGDAAMDIGIIDREYRYRLANITESVRQQSRSVIYDGITGAMSGFAAGSQLKGALDELNKK